MRLVVIMLAALVFMSCSAGSTKIVEQSGTFISPATLPAPDELPVRSVAAYITHRTGSDFTTSRNVTAVGETGVFEPSWNDGSGELAFACYMFALEGAENGRFFSHEWSVVPPDGKLWIGLANRVKNSWDWTQQTPNEDMLISDVAPYLNEDEELMMVILLVTAGEYTLDTLDVLGDPPSLERITPVVVMPGEQVEFQAICSGTEPLAYEWDFGSAAEPATSTEARPVVDITSSPGTYSVSLRITNYVGEDTGDFDLTVKDWYIEVETGKLVATALCSEAVVGQVVPVAVYTGDFPADAKFNYMNGVAVTCEVGGDYVDGTFNVGKPGGSRRAPDGIFAEMSPCPESFYVPNDFAMHAAAVDGDPSLVFLGFNVTPLDGGEMTAGGVLFNFGMSFDAPGTYHLGFIDFVGCRRTYYSDGIANEFDWLDISNTGVPNTIVVTSE